MHTISAGLIKLPLTLGTSAEDCGTQPEDTRTRSADWLDTLLFAQLRCDGYAANPM